MKLIIHPDKLVSGLQKVMGVVERRMTLPVLSNVLCSISEKTMQFTATDMEVEIEILIELDVPCVLTQFTIPAHKFFDICKSLTTDEIEISYDNQKITLKTDSACYILATLPAADFPNIEEDQPIIEFVLSQANLKRLLEKTQYAMADQDVRYYLNGMLWQVVDGVLHTVAMDGHRFAHAELELACGETPAQQVLVPHKGIVELNRLLDKNDDPVTVKFCANYLWVDIDNVRFRCKLIDGVFPDYRMILRNIGEKSLTLEKSTFKQSLSRLAILSSSQLNAVRIEIHPNAMRLLAVNQEQDEAWEELPIQYDGDPVVLGFNIQYLLDTLSVIAADTVTIHFEHLDKGVLLEGSKDENASFIIMPLRL